MSVNANLHNIRSMVIGCVASFSFAEGATSAAVAGGVSYPFRDFGNLSVVDFDPKVETQPRTVCIPGVGRREIGNQPVLSSLSYKLKSNEADPLKLGYAFNASISGDLVVAALSAVAGQPFDFTVAPAIIGRWYQLRTVAGVAVRNVTVVTIPTLVLGTDFVIEGTTGRIRFLTVQAASRTPTITTTAITADPSNSAMTVLNPMQVPIRRGFGRLIITDTDANNNVVIDHVDFNCEIIMEGSGLNSQDGKSGAEVSIKVTVQDVTGTMYVRS
jgi:hypothetical protein